MPNSSTSPTGSFSQSVRTEDLGQKQKPMSFVHDRLHAKPGSDHLTITNGLICAPASETMLEDNERFIKCAFFRYFL